MNTLRAVNPSVLALAETAGMTLPLDELEDQWRSNALEFVYARDFEYMAFDQVAEKLTQATGIQFSTLETELFLSGIRIEALLLARLRASGRITKHLQFPLSAALLSKRCEMLRLLKIRIQTVKGSAVSHSRSFTCLKDSKSTEDSTTWTKEPETNRYRVVLTTIFALSLSLIVFFMATNAGGPGWIASVLGLTTIISGILMLFEYSYNVSEPKLHPLSSIWQKSAWASRQGEHLGCGVVVGMVLLALAIPFLFSGKGGAMIALVLISAACALIRR